MLCKELWFFWRQVCSFFSWSWHIRQSLCSTMQSWTLKWESRQPDLWSIEITRSCSKLVEILVVICSSSWFVAVSVPIYFIFKSFELRRQTTKIDFLTFSFVYNWQVIELPDVNNYRHSMVSILVFLSQLQVCSNYGTQL